MPSGSPATLTTVHQDEVLTGEAVALDVQPLGFFLRAVGGLIDLVLAAVLLLTFLFASSALVANGAIPAAAGQMLFIVVFAIVAIVVPTTVETLTRGRSLGKLAVGGRIVRSDGGAIGFRHAAIRALAGVLEVYLTLGSVALLVGAFTPRAQRLGDLLAGTYAVRSRVPAEAALRVFVPPYLQAWAAAADIGRIPDATARRAAQFIRQAGRMAPLSRAGMAQAIAGELSAHVAPPPPPGTGPDDYLAAVVAERRNREFTRLSQSRRRNTEMGQRLQRLPFAE